MQEHPPQDSGGYWRSLKKKESSKGFTLVELIVVIVILAILAAILIPGLLKWIDQAKDKKYELEAREIAQAAEAALAQMYGQGAGALDLVGGEEDHYLLKAGGSTDLMKYSPFSGELGKFTDATVKEIRIYGNSDGGTPKKWGGSATGFEITFTPSGETEPITARLSPDDDRWVINKSSDESGEDPDEDYIAEAEELMDALKSAYAKLKAEGVEVTEGQIPGKISDHPWNDYNYYDDFWDYGIRAVNPEYGDGPYVETALKDFTDAKIAELALWGTWEVPDGSSWDFRSWDGNVGAARIIFLASDDTGICARYHINYGWKIEKIPDEYLGNWFEL